MGYEFETMSEERLAAWLSEPRNAVVATIRKNGATHQSPVWYLYEDGVFNIPVLVNSVKYRNLERDPRISICMDGGYPDLSAVTVTGTAEIVRGRRERDMYERICRRYYDNDEDNRKGSETFHRSIPAGSKPGRDRYPATLIEPVFYALPTMTLSYRPAQRP